MAYVTYKFSPEGVLVPDKGRDYPAYETADTYDIDDLTMIGFTPKELPIDHGDGVVEMQLCFVVPEEPSTVFGPDDSRNYELPPDELEPELTDEEAEEVAKSILSIPRPVPAIHGGGLAKSFYGLDVETEDGLKRILDVLPIMDIEFVQQLASEIWPDAQTEDSDPELLRAEVKGFCLDQLGVLNVELEGSKA